MEVATAAAAWALRAACQSTLTSTWLRAFCPPIPDAKELAERLSSGAQIYYPGDDKFAEATARWSVLDTPTISVVVAPTTENDVVETVKYANDHNLPFLAVNGGHGAITTVGRMEHGIEIWMGQLNQVEILQSGAMAKMGGGTLVKTATDALWAAGKQTVTGLCECTSILGPGLGGGHGVLQGHYGLVLDQFVSMNVVLADGSLQTIDENSDLWWAMKGAGHNFGIVTSVTSKIYDIQHRDWAYQSFTFTGDKIEGLFEAINAHLLKNGTQPVGVVNYGFFFRDATLGPATMFFILQEGVSAVDAEFTQPFLDLGPVATSANAGDYTNLASWTSNDNASPPCQKAGLANTRFPIDHEIYDIPSQREAFDLFSSVTRDIPALNGSLFLYEGYSLQGVRAIPDDSTAYPFRGDALLQAPLILYAQDGPELESKAAQFGQDLRNIVYKGTGRKELHTYVNYAFGSESKMNMYGYEQWRQDRLLELKNKYDPQRKFSFYAPIA